MHLSRSNENSQRQERYPKALRLPMVGAQSTLKPANSAIDSFHPRDYSRIDLHLRRTRAIHGRHRSDYRERRSHEYSC